MPLNLTQLLGEAWCITVAPLSTMETLDRMGVTQQREIAEAVRELGERPVLLAKPAAPGWTLVLQVASTTGWTGLDPAVLYRLSAGGAACSVMSDPNRIQATFAADGDVHATLDLITGARWGTPPEPVLAAFDTTLPFGQRAPGVLEAMIGAPIDASLFQDPWTGGTP